MGVPAWVCDGRRADGRPFHRRAFAAAAAATAAAPVATVVLVVVVVVVAAAAAVRGSLPAGAPPAAAGSPPSPVVRTAAAAAGRAANASSDARTVAWVTDLREAAAASLPPLPSADLFRRHVGLFTLHAGHGLAAGQVLLEVGVSQLDTPFVLSSEFSALDAAAREWYLLRRVDLTSNFPDGVFAFRLAPNVFPPTLELYHPPISQRSVNPTSVAGRQAVAGVSASTLQSFPARPTGDGRLLIDAGPWVAASFHVHLFRDWSTLFVGGAARPRQVTFAVNVVSPDGIGGALKVTALGLPRKLMTPRPMDDRIGYFGTKLSWVDDYAGKRPLTETYINKWDLAKHPVLTYYVDPSVPREFWPAVVDGITRWNPAFAAAGYRRPVLRAVVPTDVDWPADYAADDARFNTVSFVPGSDGAAVGHTKVDPRTGELLNADIIVDDDFLRATPAQYRLWFDDGRAGLAVSRAGAAGVTASLLGTRSANAPGRPVSGSEEDFMYQVLADTTAHEVGHTVGLRHNFRGSAGIPWSQLKNDTYVGIHGLSTSVMDYVPTAPLPRAKDGDAQRYFASPVVGAYDIAAIRYGYTDWRSEGDARAFAESVAAAGLDVGVDDDVETDALAQRFDLSATPLEWHRHHVRTVQRRVRRLARTARDRPSTSAADLYDAVETLLLSGVASLRSAAQLVGATVTSRRRTGGRPAVTPISSATEVAAARWVLSQLHPTDGLLSSATVATVAPHVLEPHRLPFFGRSTLGRAPPLLAARLHEDRDKVLSTLLTPSRLARLSANVAAAAATGGRDARRRLSVPALLGSISGTFFGDAWEDLRPPAAVTGGSLFRAEAQARWVRTLTSLATPAPADAAKDGGGGLLPLDLALKLYREPLPAAAVAAAAGELSRIAAAVASAVAAAPDSTHLRGLRLATAAFVVA